MHKIARIAIAGVPNSGKTTLFNSLTGSRQKVGNWPGVTVEKFEGTFPLQGSKVELVDLPGTYNLSPDSEDQKLAERVIREGEYDLILNVVDATNLSRNLFLTMDLKERTNQIIVLLNMLDVAEKEGLEIDEERLSKDLGLPVIPVIAVDKGSVLNAIKQIEKTIEHLPVHESHISRSEVLDTVKKFSHIDKICSRVVKEKKDRNENFTNKIDNVVMNRFAAIPIFLASMFVTFWFAIGLGSVFIDFFDIIGGLLFVDIPGALLGSLGSPEWLVAIATGIGTGCQTVATFVPVVFFMFLALAILEDLGYMARVGVVADRFMRKIGLPGSAFIPMIVGFGCTVPAVMAARTLNTKRDRFMTIFMAPFMSCGARLPVYALFCAALFGAYSGLAVFLIYLSGVFMAILTGYFLKNTLFKGTPSHFVMDLPLYHTPQTNAVFKSAWLRMRNFIKRAGTIVIAAVFVLSVINSIGYKNGEISFGNEDSQVSILAYAGKLIAPVFEPMGISKENWPASVALFTGLFAKEAIVGTLNSLYATMEQNTPEKSKETTNGGLDIVGKIVKAFSTVGDSFLGKISSFDILGIGLIAEDSEAISAKIGADTAIYKQIAAYFTVFSAFAYLLFVLMYFPCLAVIGAAQQEMGGFYAGVMAAYSTMLAWAVATLFYQIAEGHNIFYIALAFLMLAVIYGGLHLIGKREKIAKEVVFSPPIRKNCCS
ncbi:ferrous iron transport protein B [Desulfopila sp. IMCC35006]|uniref:ferrous iron transport protein B n=1 Tax=Desulfopila sp. IMCC35006 TaxID=2569542 RepID=UPI0010AC7672|nr:ferrous iron transport protein B [Desulfopila sp. IMCC35006]TKB23730.1 ferrous iron transport protein B [Desulfopila sp. IMCC35006]